MHRRRLRFGCFTAGRPPLSDAIGATIVKRPKLLAYRRKVKRITEQVVLLVEQFEDGVGESSAAKVIPYNATPLDIGMAADGGEEG